MLPGRCDSLFIAATAAGLPGRVARVVYADLRTADVREVLARRLAGDFDSLYELVVASLHDLSEQPAC